MNRHLPSTFLAAYVATSADGLHFDEPRKWTFDDGAELGRYNTQAHWVTHQWWAFPRVHAARREQ